MQTNPESNAYHWYLHPLLLFPVYLPRACGIFQTQFSVWTHMNRLPAENVWTRKTQQESFSTNDRVNSCLFMHAISIDYTYKIQSFVCSHWLYKRNISNELHSLSIVRVWNVKANSLSDILHPIKQEKRWSYMYYTQQNIQSLQSYSNCKSNF